MNLRPRFSEWLPLSTQQMRLRNLTRIQGLNIKCADSDDAYIFYTLHREKHSDAFYTSEALPQRHFQLKWAEINAGEELRKSTANCVCVKVWTRWIADKKHVALQKTENAAAHTHTHTTPDAVNMNGIATECKEPRSALTKQLANVSLSPSKLPRPPERLLFTWAVYFSGLMPLNEQCEDARWRVNSLIFQLNGEYFTSPEQFTTEGLRDQLSVNYQRYSASVPKSISQTTRDEFSINSPSVSRSSSPVSLDKAQDLLGMSTSRYPLLNCAAADIRQSYNLQQMLKIQDLQRLHLKKLRECRDICSDIKLLSIRCITRSEVRSKLRATSHSSSYSGSSAHHHYQHLQHHSMGRTLSVLLAEQHRIEPGVLYNAQQLQLQLETLRSKKRLLVAEHATYSKRIAAQRQSLMKYQNARSKQQKWLAEQWAKLAAEQKEVTVSEQERMAKRHEKRLLIQQIERRMSTLCIELREIYNIARQETGNYSICGIRVPNLDAYVSDARYVHSLSLEQASPLALSAALGYIAHLVQMIAIIINKPLRNPIIYESSRTRIMDIIKELPFTSREFPLFTRSAMPSKPVKYAIFLLNQNIAQLCYDITGRRCDLRATFENIVHIFNLLADVERSHREVRFESCTLPADRLTVSADELDDGATMASLKPQQQQQQQQQLQHQHQATTPLNNNINDAETLSKSHSSVDMNHVPVAPMSGYMQLLTPSSASQALAIEGYATSQRVCRSVGSYSDCEDDFKDIIEHTYSNSDSNIQFQNENS